MASLSSNHHSEFASEQSQLLQDIARDGNAGEYGYDENPQSNTFEDIDPATLLESLANYVHPDNEPLANREAPITSEGHFESLLQAVASADGQEAAQASRGETKSKSPTRQIANHFSFAKGKTTSARSKRKRQEAEEEDSGDESFGFIVTNKSTRKKYKDTAEQLALEEEIWGPEDYDEIEGDVSQVRPEYQRISGSDARAAGVQSAAALFRRPSAASKKYTRPPMSKLFTSLELHPEHFIHLQAAAKNYMLDERYPSRAECVGNRGRGDTDLTKIKLFDCVQAFLEDEGWGEKCFGAKAPGAANRKLKWPQMKQKIVLAISPLLRRMVTNERQRLYALQARASKSQSNPPKPKPKSQQRIAGAPSPSPSPAPVIDPNLNNYRYDVDENFSSRQSREPSTPEASTKNASAASDQVSKRPEAGLSKKYLINIVRGTHRIMPEVSLSSCPRLSSLTKHVDAIIDNENLKIGNIKVFGTTGLKEVLTEEDWKNVIAAVMELEWFYEEIKCVVEVEEV